MSGNFAMVCIGFAGVVLGIIATLLYERHKEVKKRQKHEQDESKPLSACRECCCPIFRWFYKGTPTAQAFDMSIANINRAISIVFLTFPAVMMLLLYVFSINCKKVALYKGYLMYLEDRLSEQISVPVFYNKGIITQFYDYWSWNISEWGAHSFPVLFLGPFIMFIFIVGTILLSFKLSGYFSNFVNEKETKTMFYRIYSIGFPIFFLSCIIFCAVCFIDLSDNWATTRMVYECCKEIYDF